MNLSRSPNIDMAKLPEESMYKIENPTKEIGYLYKTDMDGNKIINETMANRWCLFGTWYIGKDGKEWREKYIRMPSTGEIKIPIMPGVIMYFDPSNTFLVLDDHKFFGNCSCDECKPKYIGKIQKL